MTWFRHEEDEHDWYPCERARLDPLRFVMPITVALLLWAIILLVGCQRGWC